MHIVTSLGLTSLMALVTCIQSTLLDDHLFKSLKAAVHWNKLDLQLLDLCAQGGGDLSDLAHFG